MSSNIPRYTYTTSPTPDWFEDLMGEDSVKDTEVKAEVMEVIGEY